MKNIEGSGTVLTGIFLLKTATFEPSEEHLLPSAMLASIIEE